MDEPIRGETGQGLDETRGATAGSGGAAVAAPQVDQHLEEPLEIEFREPPGKLRQHASQLVLGLGVVVSLTIGLMVYVAATPEGPVAAATTDDYRADVPEEEAQPRSRSSGSRAPARAGGGGGGGGRGSYAPAGDVSDVFCRPRDGETTASWQRRVPLYCVDRYSPPR